MKAGIEAHDLRESWDCIDETLDRYQAVGLMIGGQRDQLGQIVKQGRADTCGAVMLAAAMHDAMTGCSDGQAIIMALQPVEKRRYQILVTGPRMQWQLSIPIRGGAIAGLRCEPGMAADAGELAAQYWLLYTLHCWEEGKLDAGGACVQHQRDICHERISVWWFR
ncbi:hypothetical protein CLAM6_20140 [Cobetia sp. AM6]|nr:hypothetical protein CLAM6_20140 [Cobetia sp. AM6]